MSKGRQTYRYILRYVYALAAVVVIVGLLIGGYYYSKLQIERGAHERVSMYHLASAAAVEALHRDAHLIHEMMHTESATLAITGVSVSGTLHSMRTVIGRLRELQSRFAGEEFESTLQRLGQSFELVATIATSDASNYEIDAAVSSLELASEQLYRLHQIAAENALAGLHDLTSRHLPTLGLLGAILTVAVFVGWYLTRLLRQSLISQEEAEGALAASQENMHHLQKQQALGQLVGGVAHDFNNLLTAIHGQAELLADDPSPNVRDSAGEITLAASQAAALTRQLLAYSRRQPVEAVPVVMNRLVGDLEPLLRRLISENIELQFDYAADCHAVKVDPSQIRQVIINIFVNARDAMPDGGSIVLATGNVVLERGDNKQVEPGEYVQLSIQDNGIGMDEDTRKRVFEPYFTTKQKGRGTGLGMAMVHGIVSAADGCIVVQSQPGRGSQFDVYLPATAQKTEAAEPQRTPVEGGLETILVVEDEEQIRTYMRSGLSSLGYTVLTASGGVEGLELCNRHAGAIDVIVSDVVMPDMNGTEFMKVALPMQPGCVAIFMSGYTEDILSQQGVGLTSIPLLPKPFKLDTLARLIRQQLASGHEQRQESRLTA